MWRHAEVARSSPKEEALQYLLMIVMACLMTGCAADVVMRNPKTDEAATCRASLKGLNPWSQQETCIADYIEQGWIRKD
jgi:hypothetical protein